SPAAEQGPPVANLLVAGQCLVPEVEQIVVHRNDLLHPFDVLHQSNQVVREELDGSNGSHSSWIESRGMDVAPLHQTEGLASIPTHMECLAVELAGEGVE